jgi:hypothetical protein
MQARPWPKPRQTTVASVGVSLPIFSFVSFSVRCFRHPCRSGACECFHRHWPAATRHGAPNQIGGDGSKQWRGTTRALRCVARTRFYFHLSPEGRGRANAVSEGEGDRMFQFRVRYPLTPTISPTGRGRRTARRENEILFFLLPAAWGEVGLPTGPARSGRPDDRLRERIRGIGCFSFRVWYPLTPTLSPAGRGSTQGRVARARHYAGRAP